MAVMAANTTRNMASMHQQIEQIASKVNILGGVIFAAAVISAFCGGAVYYLNLKKNALQKTVSDSEKARISLLDDKVSATEIKLTATEGKLTAAEKAAKEDREARLAIEAKLAPRALTADQRVKLVGFLKKNKTADPFALYVAFEADDGVAYYRDLMGTFKEGDWNIKDGHRTTDRAEWGLAIIYKRVGSEPIPPIAIMLEKALASAGIYSRIMGNIRPEAEDLTLLYIGTKTPP